MIRIICEDGARFEAETYEDLVSAMKLDMWLPQSREEYMAGVAKRCEVWDGSKIRYSNAKEFIHELKRVGVIKVIMIDGQGSARR